ncbi:MAG TPA: TetR family transcriptional regulator [Thermoleophilaceae bacterium]|nr:TetR family transcriptional regulator [Thermoleophilaceae bacterium]
MILDAAVGVFARRGFTACRVSDVADEAGVAYGLVYHYFDSKEEILNTLFLERWGVMLDAIGEIDARDLPSRDKLRSVAGFIIDSYRHEPDLMKVIIVEVTRAANTFGREHLDQIREAYSMIVDPWGEVLARAPQEGATFVAADLDLARQDEIRQKLPSLANRVEAAYRWPEGVHL